MYSTFCSTGWFFPVWTSRIYFSRYLCHLVPPSAKASWVKRKTTTGWSKVSPPKQDHGGKCEELEDDTLSFLWKLVSLHLVISSIRTTTIQEKITCKVLAPIDVGHKQMEVNNYATHGYVWAIRLYSTSHLPTMRWVPGHIQRKSHTWPLAPYL